jgi:hypothetical protein
VKKLVILVISIIIICVGCGIREKEVNIENPGTIQAVVPGNEIITSKENPNKIQTGIPENETVASLSPNGKYRAEAYGTNQNVTAGGLFPYEEIRVVDVENNEILFKMPGYYAVDFVWSPDGRYVGIYYEARTYGESVIYDTKNRKSISLPKLRDIASHYGESNKPQENRPDPYFHITAWEDDETVVIDFSWNRENVEPFNGRFTYNIDTQKVSYK